MSVGVVALCVGCLAGSVVCLWLARLYLRHGDALLRDVERACDRLERLEKLRPGGVK